MAVKTETERDYFLEITPG